MELGQRIARGSNGWNPELCEPGLSSGWRTRCNRLRARDLGLDFLKVDSSFVRGIDSNPGNAAFLKGLSGIAHGIGLQVLAEGVASQAEFEALKALGFDGATGPVVKEG